MENENTYIDTRLNQLEKGMQEILTLLRQVVPTPTKEDFLKHCGEKGILIIDELNKRGKMPMLTSRK